MMNNGTVTYLRLVIKDQPKRKNTVIATIVLIQIRSKSMKMSKEKRNRKPVSSARYLPGSERNTEYIFVPIELFGYRQYVRRVRVPRPTSNIPRYGCLSTV